MVDETSRDAATKPGTKVRHFLDAESQVWTVREVKHEGYDRRSTNSLLFERHDVVRRVRNFPANWATLSDAELVALSNGR